MHAKPIALALLSYLPYPDRCLYRRVCKSWNTAALALRSAFPGPEHEYAFSTGWMFSVDTVPSQELLDDDEESWSVFTREEILAEPAQRYIFEWGKRHINLYRFTVNPQKYVYEPLYEFLMQHEHGGKWIWEDVESTMNCWWSYALKVLANGNSGVSAVMEDYDNGPFLKDWLSHGYPRTWPWYVMEHSGLLTLYTQMRKFTEHHLMGDVSKADYASVLETFQTNRNYLITAFLKRIQFHLGMFRLTFPESRHIPKVTLATIFSGKEYGEGTTKVVCKPELFDGVGHFFFYQHILDNLMRLAILMVTVNTNDHFLCHAIYLWKKGKQNKLQRWIRRFYQTRLSRMKRERLYRMVNENTRWTFDFSLHKVLDIPELTPTQRVILSLCKGVDFETRCAEAECDIDPLTADYWVFMYQSEYAKEERPTKRVKV